MNESKRSEGSIELTLRRWVAAEPERVWRAWTDAGELQVWWGPAEVLCISAEVDLRVGGHYRIGNELPDGNVIWIDGTYEIVEPPQHLRYSWQTDLDRDSVQSVDVRFRPHENGTEILICHQRIPNETLRENHEYGWLGCLDGLDQFLAKRA